jgi:hypothetical protein
MTRLLHALALVSLLALSGCYEEDVTVVLQPDGSGTLTLSYTEGGGVAAMGGLFEFGDTTKEQRANELAAKHMSRWTGILAWSDVSATIGEEGRPSFTATGWFEDLNQVGKGGEGQSGATWSLTREGDTLTVSLADSVEAGGEGGFGDMGPDAADVFDEPLDDLRGQKMALPLLMQGMLSGFHANVTLTLPSPATEPEGWTTAEGATLSLVRDPAWAGATIRRSFDAAIKVRERVDKGELTREQGEAELTALRQELDRHTARCEAALTVDPAFRGKLEAALEAWQTSPWKRLLEQAIVEAAEAEARDAEMERWQEESIETPPPEGLTRTEPDAFEPNDSRRRAAPIGPDAYADLLLDSDDWYRIDVPGAFELRVTVLYDERKPGMLSLEITDEQGNELADETMSSPDHTAQARFAPGKTRTLLIHVESYGDEPRPYHLQVELAPFEAVDRFEPNNTAAAAKPLEAGVHADLVCDGADHYRVTAEAGQVVSVRVIDPSGDEMVNRLMLELTASDESSFMPTTLARSSFVARGAPRLTCRGTGQELLLEVDTSYTTGEGGGIPYALELIVSDEPKPDAFEPNQARKQATKIAPGTHANLYADPEDWYQVRVPTGKQLVLGYEVQGDGGQELKVEIVGWERRQALVERSGVRGTLRCGTGEAVALFVHVEAPGLVGYQLSVELADFEPADAFEPNDTRKQATPIAAGELGELVCTGEDWYAIELEAGQTVTVSVALAGGEERDELGRMKSLDVQLMDPIGMKVAEYSSWQPEPLTAPIASSGTYYVRVHADGESVGLGYTLSVTAE